MQLYSETDLDLVELRFELRGSSGRYEGRVILPDGESWTAPIELGVDPDEVLALRQGSVIRPAGRQKGADPAQRLGGRLFEALFGRRLGLLYKKTLHESSTQGKGFRFRVVLPVGDQVADLPWELLYDREFRSDYVALGQGTALVREALDTDAPPLMPVDGRLRVLLATFNDAQLPLDVDREVSAIRQALDGVADIEHIHRPDARSVLGLLAAGPWHVVHYIGTGMPAARPGDPQSIVVGSLTTGMSDQIPGDELVAALAEVNDLRLVVLNACKTDRIAASLATRVPAAIGLLGDVVDLSAVRLATTLYGQIGQGAHLEQALAAARRVVDYENPGSLDWSAPVLYLRGGGQPLVRRISTPEVNAAGVEADSEPAGASPPAAPEDAEQEYLVARLDVDRQNLAALETAATQSADSMPIGVGAELERLRKRVAETEAELGLKRQQ
jgi:hypothetical protein